MKVNPEAEFEAKETARLAQDAMAEYARKGQRQMENAILLAALLDGVSPAVLSKRALALRKAGLLTDRPLSVSKLMAELQEVVDEIHDAVRDRLEK